MDIKISIGISNKLDSFIAGKEAAKSAFYQLGKPDPDIIIAFISTIFNQSEAIKGIRSVIKEVPLIGCSSVAAITPLGIFKNSVCVGAISSESLKFSTGIGININKNPRTAGNTAAKQSAEQKDTARQVYVMLSDPLSGNAADILRGAQEIMGTRFPITGGSATDEGSFQKTYQYFNNDVYTDAVVGMLISGDFNISIGKAHGWLPIGRPHKVTRSKSNIISEFNKKRAVELYQDYLGKTFDELKTAGIGKTCSMYPLGMRIKERKEYLLRSPLKIDNTGSLILNAEIPEKEDINLMIGDKNTALDAVKKACGSALKNVKKSNVKFAFVFSDIARLQLLRKDSQKEIDIIKSLIGQNVPFFGCYTCGEYAPIDLRGDQGQPYFHSHVISVVLFY